MRGPLGGRAAAAHLVARAGVLAVLLVSSAEAQWAQTAPSDCGAIVKNCVACRYYFYQGTPTKPVCTACAPGYILRSSGRLCACAPGYYTPEDAPATSGFACEPCGAGAGAGAASYWCPGARVTPASSKSRFGCGRFKLTTTQYAKSDAECVVQPGYGWAPGDNSTQCPPGTFNPGLNTRPCQRCAGGLTTQAPGATAAGQCVAGVGTSYTFGKATACPRGTYKDSVSNDECQPCPSGMTTPLLPPNSTAGAQSGLDCTVLLPGFSLPANPDVGATPAEQCPKNWFREGELPGVSSSSTAVPCTPCPAGTTTARAGAAAGAECVANTTACARGSYRGYLNDCQVCPAGMMTPKLPPNSTAEATSSAECTVLLPGYSLPANPTVGTTAATPCALSFFREGELAGVSPLSPAVPCTPCPGGGVTNRTGATSRSECIAPRATGTACPSGAYTVPAGCAACPQPAGYAGRMVSRPGVNTLQDCLPEFPTDATDALNGQTWDLIPMDPSVLVLAGTMDVLGCQTACQADPNCQARGITAAGRGSYMAYYGGGAPDGDGQDKCYLRVAGVVRQITAASIGGSWDAPNARLAAFKAGGAGAYVVYPAAPGESLGTPISGQPAPLAAARAACDADAACAGIVSAAPGGGAAQGWLAFGGRPQVEASGKVRLTGANISPWGA